MKKQVNKEHYNFKSYVTKERWISMWHQLDEVVKFNPAKVLEVGPGPGLFKVSGKAIGLNIETLDIDPDLEPDYVASVFEMPFKDGEFDVVCAFQMLEHLPYEKSLAAFKEICRIAKKGVVISLPDAERRFPFVIQMLNRNKIGIAVRRPTFKLESHSFDGEHYWEVNKNGYELAKIKADFISDRFQLTKSYRVKENLYHRFFVFSKT